MALPLGELSPQATERVLAATVYPLRRRFAQTPLPKGEARNVRKEVFWRKTLALCLCKICKTRPGRRQIRPGLCRKNSLSGRSVRPGAKAAKKPGGFLDSARISGTRNPRSFCQRRSGQARRLIGRAPQRMDHQAPEHLKSTANDLSGTRMCSARKNTQEIFRQRRSYLTLPAQNGKIRKTKQRKRHHGNIPDPAGDEALVPADL